MDTKTLLNTVAEKIGRNPDDVSAMVKALGGILADAVKQGDSVSVPGFGTFESKMRMERVANHPSSGKKILVPPKLSLVFKPSAILKQKVRNS